MTPELWKRLKSLFHAALERNAEERAAFVSAACGGDAELKSHLERLLAAEAQPMGSQDRPLAAVAEFFPASTTRFEPGETVLGRFHIVRLIGRGGMGEVYRARDTKLGRDVAIKVLPEAFARDRERRARFEREAKFLAALNHPNIAAIYGAEDAGPTDALVMELAEGPTLADRIASGPIQLAEVLPIARQIADALEYAHERGVVHRDLKPANIKVSSDGFVKILDFGLARAVEGAADVSNIGDSPTITQMATESGVLLGTAAYMSPEQAKGRPVDRRVDIWAFGCVLYEMLTGNKAFPADTATETLAAILNKEPDWSLLPSGAAMHIRVLLHRCLQKDPRQRLRDIGDARISLDEVLSGAAEGAPVLAVAAPLWRRAVPWALLGVTALALGVPAFVHLREKPPESAATIRFQVALPEKGNSVDRLALSPDARHLAFTTMAQDGSTQLWLRDLDSLVSRPLPSTDGARSPFWSPDSRSVAFQSGSKLLRVDISKGVPQVICILDRPHGFFGGAWNPDGVILFGSYKGLMKVSAAGGEPSTLIKSRPSVGEFWLGYPSFLPDGRHFLYGAIEWNSFVTYAGSLDAGDEQQSSKPLVSVGISLYVPSLGGGPGSIMFGKSDGTLMAQAFDASRLELKGDPSFVAEGVVHFNVSANGVVAYVGGATSRQLTWFDRQGKVLGTVGEPGIYPSPAISPDGRIVAVPQYDSSGRTDLWLYDLERGTRTPFTFNGRPNVIPVWSPDGSRIAFLSDDRKGLAVICQKPVNGVGQKETFETVPPHPAAPTDWSRDGRYLIEQVYGDTYSIWLLPLSLGQASSEHKPIPLLNEGFNTINARLSPDSKWIAYDSDETGRDEIFVRTFPNPEGKWKVSTNGGTNPLWSRDGKELYYIALDGNLMATNVKSRPDGSFDADAAKVLFNPHAGPNRLARFDVTKDGRFLIPTFPTSTQQSGAPITVIVNWRPK